MIKIGLIGDFISSPDFQCDEHLLKQIQSTDINIANLEAPFIEKGMRPDKNTAGLYQLNPDCRLLNELNIKAVSLANNHIFDFGLQGFHNTIRILNAEKIKYFGAGNHIKEAASLKHINIKGINIGIGGFISPYLTKNKAKKNKAGVAPLFQRQVISALQNSNADIKILYNHWNQEFEHYPEPLFYEQAKQMNAYSNAIAGSHPHCIQGIESDNEKNIFHSLGNFSVPHQKYYYKKLGQYPDYCYEAFFLIINIDSKLNIKYDIIPYKISYDGQNLKMLDEKERSNFMERLNQLSAPFNKSYSQYKTFYKNNKNRKFRPTLRKNHTINLLQLWMTRSQLKLIRKLSEIFSKFLAFLGLKKFIRKNFSFIFDRLFKL